MQVSHTVNENDGQAQTALILSYELPYAVTVSVISSSDIATGKWYVMCFMYILCCITEEDYQFGPYSVTFPAGTTIARLNIPILNDNILEGNENFTLIINSSSPPDNIFIGDDDRVTVIIADDDCKLQIQQKC